MEGGDWLKDRFDWKQALGPATDRPGHWNGNWGYWSTDGPRLTLSAHSLSAADMLGCGPEDVKQDRAAASCGCAMWLIGSSGGRPAWQGFMQGGQLASGRPALLLGLCPAHHPAAPSCMLRPVESTFCPRSRVQSCHCGVGDELHINLIHSCCRAGPV